MRDDADGRLDARIDSPAREGLTGTAPQSVYQRLRDVEQVTVPPDGSPIESQPPWRGDFPIDWPQDHYVERRDFMKFMVLTSLAFTVGQVWIGAQNWIRRRRGIPEMTRIGNMADVPVGSTRVFNYPTEHDPCILIRPTEGTLLAYGQKCTHLSCAVLPDIEAGVINCPCHDGVFELSTGRPIAGPPRRPLSLVHLDVRDNDIFATGVEERML